MEQQKKYKQGDSFDFYFLENRLKNKFKNSFN